MEQEDQVEDVQKHKVFHPATLRQKEMTVQQQSETIAETTLQENKGIASLYILLS